MPFSRPEMKPVCFAFETKMAKNSWSSHRRRWVTPNHSLNRTARRHAPLTFVLRHRQPPYFAHPVEESTMLTNAPIYSYIPARDVARALAFYEGKLGFKPKVETAGGIVYEFAGATACFLYETPNAGTSQASQAFWHVENV